MTLDSSDKENNNDLPEDEANSAKKRILEELQQLSINGKIEEMRKQTKNAIFIAGRMALAGQTTVFFAGPNTGKTLIALKLISEAIANEAIGKHVYHINLDDTFEGLIEKGVLGNRHGFKVIAPDVFSNPNKNFPELVDELVRGGVAGDIVFILDTIKKFVDPMHKKASSEFMTVCRKFASAGGSIIALAHVNKLANDSGESIPAGTSDILDDSDCSYIMNIIGDEKRQGQQNRVVEFTNSKKRGPVVETAVYSYTTFDDDYPRMFNSVKLIDGNDADLVRAEKALATEKAQDATIIEAISKLLHTSALIPQKELLDGLPEFSRRQAIDCLKRWSCATEDGGLWTLEKGDRNSNRYGLNQ